MSSAVTSAAVTGLHVPAPATPGPRPAVDVRLREHGATVVAMTFAAGQVLPNHHSTHPIVILGQAGTVSVTVGKDKFTVARGDAMHIDATVVHAVSADADAVITVMMLTPA